MFKAIITTIFVVLSLIWGGKYVYGKYQETLVQKAAIDDIYLYNLRTGKQQTLRSITDEKMTLVYYTSTSCPVCVKQRKMFSELPAGQRKSIQWLDIVSSPAGIADWMSKYGAMHDWVTLDSRYDFSNALHLNVTPIIILINRDNNIVYYNRGYMSKSQWNKELFPLILNSEFDI